jgi:F-type H+-transporting ATPase subunit b
MDALDALGINVGLLVAQTANLLLLLLILGAVAYRPMTKMLRERRERIAEGINNARKAEEALATAEADKQKVLDEARAEAQRIIADARSRAEEVTEQVKTDAQEEARRIREQAEADAAAERDRLLADMRDQIASLSIAAANHLLGEGLDEKRQKAAVKDFFTNVPAEAKGLGTALTVITAVPLTQAEMKNFKKELGTDDITFETDPGILGGVVVRAPGQQVDGSFAYQLETMRTTLS